jgi:hypothetical protein
MSDKRYEANIIRATAVEPANNLESTSAPGVWSIDEVVELKKKNKWPTVGNVVVNVEDVYSTFVYEGNSAAQVIENDISLSNTGEGGSVDFSAGSTTRINLPAHSDFGFGTGDWTIEYFIFMGDNANYLEHVDFRTSSQDSSHTVPIIYSDSSGTLYFFTAGNNRITSSSSALSEGTFYHIAVAKSGSTTKMFINGTQAGSDYTDNNDYAAPANAWSIGGSVEQNNYNVRGHMSNVRIVKGTALYTSNFTAPTSALTAVTNTKLLTLQGSTPFVDNSGNSHTITQNGSPVAFNFGPFTGSSGEGGLVWIKKRNGSTTHSLVDSVRGDGKMIQSSSTDAEISNVGYAQALTSTGFKVYNWTTVNNSGDSYVSWTFKKQSKFFDIVQYTGNATNRTIAHNLGSVPGMIMIKDLSGTGAWAVYHRSVNNETSPENYVLTLNTTAGDSTGVWNSTAPTSSVFSVGTDGTVNESGRNFIAYLFAHNNNDGEFGPTQDQDIIKCGHVQTNSSEEATVELGFEPQWILFKRYNSSTGGDWNIYDNMRGLQGAFVSFAELLEANTSDEADTTTNRIAVTSTGFKMDNYGTNRPYIYVAIRRGPMATPTAATDVFSLVSQAGGYQANRKATTGFPVDFAFNVQLSPGADKYMYDRMRGGKRDLKSSQDHVEGTNSPAPLQFDYMDGLTHALFNSSNNVILSMWRRAPGYFDIVTYQGTGSARTLTHNLGVAPEMIWIKDRGRTQNWAVYHANNTSEPATEYLRLNADYATTDNNTYWNDTEPTSSVFTVGTDGDVNASGQDYIAYLFATLAGISKLGSFVADGNAQNIDCGFSSGARYVLIKKTTTNFNWRIWDTTRGIVAGDDPYYYLDTDNANTTNGDWVDPYSSGFSITSAFSNGTYVFYAIA